MTGDKHRDPGDGRNHATVDDLEYGITSTCGRRGRGIQWETATGPVDCDDCRVLALIDGVRAAQAGRRGDDRASATRLELHPDVEAALLRSQLWHAFGDRLGPFGRRRLFGAEIVAEAGLPAGGWRLVAGQGTV
jgi:hypothetical protein